jgi:mannose-6-phosphate isomerase class I
MVNRAHIEEAVNAGSGVLRLQPCWVPRSFMIPGRRLKLHPNDLYAFGGHRGGINERWFSSTTKASNGPDTTPDEGLSYVRTAKGEKFLLQEAVETAGDLLLGAEVMEREGGWNLLCKFFDNMGPIPHHMHQSDEFAELVGFKGKPEAYYFPPQYNQILNNFPHTYMGLEPGTTKEQIRECLERWNEGDNGILKYARAYRLVPGEGWQINPGILHAPGSLVTYEPQVNSDVFAMFQSEVEGRIVDRFLLTKDVLAEHADDADYLISMLDWEANVNPRFAESNKTFPKPVKDAAEMETEGYREVWVTYGTKFYSAKELTVHPGKSVTIKDAAAYGVILTQGHGTVNGLTVSTPSMIRFGAMTEDEFFVTAAAAEKGVVIENKSSSDPLVLLKHFGPGNPDAASLVKK